MSVAAVLCVVLIALPASLVGRLLPAAVVAEDLSGTVWHGSAGHVTVDGRDAGAIEWKLHPLPLLGLDVAADLHWVKIGFEADGAVDWSTRGLTLRGVTGGGPIDDLRDFGLGLGWHGIANFKCTLLKLTFGTGNSAGGAIRLESAVGDVEISDLVSPQVAGGEDLGGYALRAADAAIVSGGEPTGTITDTGGPLEVRATLRLSADLRTVTLSGTVKERADASAALRAQLADLGKLHSRDAQGAIPVDLEFTL
jgi:hypothetical protein